MDEKVDDSMLTVADDERGCDDGGSASRQGPFPTLAAYVDGIIVGFSSTGVPIVAFPGNPQQTGVTAATIIPVDASDIGKRVALIFNNGDAAWPLIVGRILTHDDECGVSREKTIDLHVDGERLVLAAGTEIVLKCGNASITLTRAGKILIRGTYLLSRSSGANKIKGGTVEIN